MKRRGFLAGLAGAAACLVAGLKTPEPIYEEIEQELARMNTRMWVSNEKTMVMRFSMGVSDWKGLYGSTG